jgi:hypothetical protein
MLEAGYYLMAIAPAKYARSLWNKSKYAIDPLLLFSNKGARLFGITHKARSPFVSQLFQTQISDL